MNKLKKVSILTALVIIVCCCCFRQQIVYRFKSDPGSYLIQLICMLIPLFVTFYFYFIESRQRKIDNEQQKKQIKEQRENQKEMIKLLDNQNQKQMELSKNLKSVAKEVNNIRRPKGLSFIYKHYNDLHEYVTYSDNVQMIVNILARNNLLEKIKKEWDDIKDDEVPLGVLTTFNAAREFLGQYRILLFISWYFIVEQTDQKEELEEFNDPFQIVINKPITISELVSSRIMASIDWTDKELSKIIDKYGLKKIHIQSEYELKAYINLYCGTDKKVIEEKFIEDVQTFQSNLNKVNSYIYKLKY